MYKHIYVTEYKVITLITMLLIGHIPFKSYTKL